jgi:hypothetical protein
MLIGTFTSAKSAPAFVNLLYVPMFLLGELWLELPKSIEWLAWTSPAFHLKKLALGDSPLIHISILAALTLLCSLVALRRLSRVG